MQNNVFTYEKTVFLGDTNAETNVYFANYIYWLGEAREAFYAAFFPVELLKSGLLLITCNVHADFKKSCYLYDRVLIQVQTANIKKASVDLLFTIMKKDTGDLVAHATQTIAFANTAGKLLPIPAEIKTIATRFCAEGEMLKPFLKIKE